MRRARRDSTNGEPALNAPWEHWTQLATEDEGGVGDMPVFTSGSGLDSIALGSFAKEIGEDVPLAQGGMPAAESWCNGSFTPNSYSCSEGASISSNNLCMCLTKHARRDSDTAALSTSHSKMSDKVVRLTDELVKLYDFGAEMQLIWPDEELQGLLHSIREKFQKGSFKAHSLDEILRDRARRAEVPDSVAFTQSKGTTRRLELARVGLLINPSAIASPCGPEADEPLRLNSLLAHIDASGLVMWQPLRIRYKRKANGNAASDSDDRSSKRRKVSDFDLTKGESRESTTAYGLAFLEQMRRTADKSGRLVATYFEKLLPRQGNEEYYKRTRMPISLETIEEKLNNGEFKTLAQLESYFKRMICNAKEFYPRSSSNFDDAERVRKALSNYMTKTNPAYGTRGYQAQPTPLPPEDGEEEDEDADGEEDEEQADAEGEDAEGEEEDEAAEDEEEPEEEETVGRGSRRRSIVLKRRESGRQSRNSVSQAKDSPRPSVSSGRPDHQYEGVPYKGLSFQQAQEKLVEELLRWQEPEYVKSPESFSSQANHWFRYEGYFEPFHNLPPRALKDYYKVVSDPLSLKKLQKMVKGVHGRGDATGVSDFKSWNAFEEKSKLLWNNAFFYNEEGSEIYELAQELEQAFSEQLKEAQAVVPEPAQPPKIKLKIGQGTETPTSSKKITIHVGGRGSSAESPAPLSANSPAAPAINGTMRTSSRLEAARSGSLSAPSPSPSTQAGLKTEDSARATPVVTGPPPPVVPAAYPQPSMPQQPMAHFAPVVTTYVEPKRLRRKGTSSKDALISRLRIQLHPNMQVEHQDVITLLPHPRELQQSGTVNLPPHYNRVFIVVMLPEFLYERQYSLWVLINKQSLKPVMQPLPGQLREERAFEVALHQGVNVIEAHLIAAIPRDEREPGGPDAELEVFTVFANVMRT
ncbi:polybromo-1 [Purpureocillium lavendulum]|uniref:Polybromo-1 n=1 Tax=Purpureocillium lavendulum TaxID=1247861 RepID=A0AB34FVL5_9HYPO|nr:polybromo-1 [Purpureocillium lavendulum]